LAGDEQPHARRSVLMDCTLWRGAWKTGRNLP
jgi:hypothetical protein